jgi:hypothetical protein
MGTVPNKGPLGLKEPKPEKNRLSVALVNAYRSGDLITCDQAQADVLAERSRQISTEGWTPEHDDSHTDGSLAMAAAAYAAYAGVTKDQHINYTDYTPGKGVYRPETWPWDWELSWWKPTTRRRDLVKAGALILAELERLDRACHAEGKPL